MKRRELLILGLILVIAASLRLYNLGATPPGLSINEAANGVSALQALHNDRPMLTYPNESGVAREGLFINLQAVSVHFFDTHAWSLRLVSAIIGILTVLGTYLLTRQLFSNWELAAMAAFLMAVGSWHVAFSRIGLAPILVPLCAVWALYHLWTALRTNRLWHWLAAGIFMGLGFHAHALFRVMPIVVLIVILAYLYALRDTFRHDKFAYTRHQLWGGMALMVTVMLVLVIPIIGHIWSYAPEFASTAPQSWAQLGMNLLKSIGMFMFRGDANWQHGIAGAPLLFWPVAALFAVGLVRNIFKLGHTTRTHGHPSVIHVLLVSWLVVGLVPATLSDSTPNALYALTVAPVIYIMAAEGLWWLYNWMCHWYHIQNQQKICVRDIHGHRYCADHSTVVVTIALVSLLLAIGVADTSRYFVDWAADENTRTSFSERLNIVAERLNALAPATLKYVVVKDPVTAWPVMFLTNTATPSTQKLHNIYYLTQTQFNRREYSKGGFIIQLNP